MLPRDKGVLEWRTPGGTLVYLIEDKEARTRSGKVRGQTAHGVAADVSFFFVPLVTFAPFCSTMRISGDSFRPGISIVPGANPWRRVETFKGGRAARRWGDTQNVFLSRGLHGCLYWV